MAEMEGRISLFFSETVLALPAQAERVALIVSNSRDKDFFFMINLFSLCFPNLLYLHMFSSQVNAVKEKGNYNVRVQTGICTAMLYRKMCIMEKL